MTGPKRSLLVTSFLFALHVRQLKICPKEAMLTSKFVGLHCLTEILEAVLEDAASSAGMRQTAVTVKDQKEKEKARALLFEHFPQVPLDTSEDLLEHAFMKGSRRVGRSGKLDGEDKIEMAATAHIRHRFTDYDTFLKQQRKALDYRDGAKTKARNRVSGQVKKIVDSWRQEEPRGVQPIHQMVRRSTTVELRQKCKKDRRPKGRPQSKPVEPVRQKLAAALDGLILGTESKKESKLLRRETTKKKRNTSRVQNLSNPKAITLFEDRMTTGVADPCLPIDSTVSESQILDGLRLDKGGQHPRRKMKKKERRVFDSTAHPTMPNSKAVDRTLVEKSERRLRREGKREKRRARKAQSRGSKFDIALLLDQQVGPLNLPPQAVKSENAKVKIRKKKKGDAVLTDLNVNAASGRMKAITMDESPDCMETFHKRQRLDAAEL